MLVTTGSPSLRSIPATASTARMAAVTGNGADFEATGVALIDPWTDLLQVSRTHLVRLLDEGRIPCRKVGAHRRVRVEDVVDYRRETESRRRKALDELTAFDQDLGLQ